MGHESWIPRKGVDTMLVSVVTVILAASCRPALQAPEAKTGTYTATFTERNVSFR